MGGTYPARLPRDMVMMFRNPRKPNARSMSSWSKKEEYKGFRTTNVALLKPIRKKAIMNIARLLAIRTRTTERTIMKKPEIMIFFFP
jgi:hypothetical protein